MKDYDSLKPPQAFLEYSLEVLHSCLTPDGIVKAEESFGRLESLLKKEKVQPEISGKIQQAKTILDDMKTRYTSKSDPFSDEYVKTLTEMRDLLLDSQEKFEQSYKEE